MLVTFCRCDQKQNDIYYPKGHQHKWTTSGKTLSTPRALELLGAIMLSYRYKTRCNVVSPVCVYLPLILRCIAQTLVAIVAPTADAREA